MVVFALGGLSKVVRVREDWAPDGVPPLWLTHLHRFDDLMVPADGDREIWNRNLIARWIKQNPVGASPGWHPAVSGWRLANMLKWVMAGNVPSRRMLASLTEHGTWLSITALHCARQDRVAVAKGLLFFARCAEGAPAVKCRRLGMKLIEQVLAEDILPDGSHGTRSIARMALIAEDLLDLLLLERDLPGTFLPPYPRRVSSAVASLLNVLAVVTHPDGQFAGFGTEDPSYDVTLSRLMDVAHTLGIVPFPIAPGTTLRRSSGFLRMQAGPAVLICDVGTDIWSGAGLRHAGHLAFELSVHGNPVINARTGAGLAHDEETSAAESATARQNCLSVEGMDTVDRHRGGAAHDFRCTKPQIWETDGVLSARIGHNGFQRFNGPFHRRQWDLSATSLTISDSLVGDWRAATARMTLAPNVRVDRDGLHVPHLIRAEVAGGSLEISHGQSHDDLSGTLRPVASLTTTLSTDVSSTRFSWNRDRQSG